MRKTFAAYRGVCLILLSVLSLPSSLLADDSSFAPVRRSLVEEYTGTWFGYSPRGYVMMERLKRDYPNNAFRVAYHYWDPMDVSSKLDPCKIKNYPVSMYNRNEYYAGTVLDFVKNGEETVAEADVNVKFVDWLDFEYSGAVCKVAIEFDKDIEANEYKVEFVLVEDGLTGKYLDWEQQTFYYGLSGEWDDPLWDLFTTNKNVDAFTYDGYLYKYIPNLMFNDVCIANSLANSVFNPYLPATKARKRIEIQYVFNGVNEIMDESDYVKASILQNPGECRIGVILTKVSDGSYVNCDWKELGVTTAVHGVRGIGSEAEYYTLDGIKVDGTRLTPGIYVVRKGNKTSKIRVR